MQKTVLPFLVKMDHGLVESRASLPCLAFFGQKRAIFGPFLPFLGVANEQKGPNTCFPMYLDVI